MQSRYPLPQSYLDFAEACGYGRALGPIHHVGTDERSSRLLGRAKRQGSAIEGGYFEHGADGTPELAAQLFPFAMSENGEYLAWDLQPELVNGTNRPEYPIYCICARMAGLRYGGKDLDELMRRLTSDEVKSAGYSPLPKTFQPLG